MSTDYEFYCVDCEEESGFGDDSNHAGEQFAMLLPYRKLLEGLGPVFERRDIWFFNDDSRGHLMEAIHFFSAHVGHDVRVRSEYGEFWDECNARVECSECKTWHYCRLAVGHEGPHKRGT